MPSPGRLDLPAVIAVVLLLFALAGPAQGGDGCSPSLGSVSAGLSASDMGGAPCDSQAPCPADEGCTTCATCCKVAVRTLVAEAARADDPPGVPVAVFPLAAAGPRGSVWHPPRG